MKINRETFGTFADNSDASLFTAVNQDGLILKVTDYGGILQSIQVPDKRGKYVALHKRRRLRYYLPQE